MKNLTIKVVVVMIMTSLASCGHYSLHESKKLARKKKKAFGRIRKTQKEKRTRTRRKQ